MDCISLFLLCCPSLYVSVHTYPPLKYRNAFVHTAALALPLSDDIDELSANPRNPGRLYKTLCRVGEPVPVNPSGEPSTVPVVVLLGQSSHSALQCLVSEDRPINPSHHSWFQAILTDDPYCIQEITEPQTNTIEQKR
jgi:hypothetical protein